MLTKTTVATQDILETNPRYVSHVLRMMRRYAPRTYAEQKPLYDLMFYRQRAQAFCALNMAALYRRSASIEAGGCSRSFWKARHREAIAEARVNRRRVLP